MADAKRAQVTGKPIWSQYPAQMLRHRCSADLAREVYPDVVLGLYTPEEMDRSDAPAPEPERPAIVAEHAQAPAPDDGPEVEGVSYASALAAIDLPGKAVAVWLAYRQALGQRAPAERVAAWEAIAARVAEVGRMASSKAGSTWLKKAIAEEDARAAIVQPAPEAT
jgi:RecT family